ncbi:hypothetical protein BDZ91DRAFT_801176 [Kalaharituber pfeilii]|nr:hypothetical protein BDZ91DRAFT_801176 [Kalaharituber pfeilii]
MPVASPNLDPKALLTMPSTPSKICFDIKGYETSHRVYTEIELSIYPPELRKPYYELEGDEMRSGKTPEEYKDEDQENYMFSPEVPVFSEKLLALSRGGNNNNCYRAGKRTWQENPGNRGFYSSVVESRATKRSPPNLDAYIEHLKQVENATANGGRFMERAMELQEAARLLSKGMERRPTYHRDLEQELRLKSVLSAYGGQLKAMETKSEGLMERVRDMESRLKAGEKFTDSGIELEFRMGLRGVKMPAAAPGPWTAPTVKSGRHRTARVY